MTASSQPAGDYHPWTTYIHAREEARRRGDRKVGTEHLLLGLLAEETLADTLEFDLRTAREALEQMDREALGAIGFGADFDVPALPVRPSAELPKRPTLREMLSHRLPLTPAAKGALGSSGRDMRRGRHIQARQVLASLLALESPDPGAQLLTRLGVNREMVRERLGT
jgi:hypothetical protein